jgi:hypothetical protein
VKSLPTFVAPVQKFGARSSSKCSTAITTSFLNPGGLCPFQFDISIHSLRLHERKIPRQTANSNLRYRLSRFLSRTVYGQYLPTVAQWHCHWHRSHECLQNTMIKSHLWMQGAAPHPSSSADASSAAKGDLDARASNLKLQSRWLFDQNPYTGQPLGSHCCNLQGQGQGINAAKDNLPIIDS